LIKNILNQYSILRKILAITINNAFNNNIFIDSFVYYINTNIFTNTQDTSRIVFVFVNINNINNNANNIINKV